MQWGRLLFDPTTPDATFAAAYSKHLGLGSVEEGCGKRPILSHFHAKAIKCYQDRLGTSMENVEGKGGICSAMMLAAMHSAGIMPLRLASFVYNTYDFTLYSEGFTTANFVGGKGADNAVVLRAL
jgi:hypothetical protein